MTEGATKRTSIVLQTSTHSRLKHYLARLIGERGNPDISLDDAVEEMLSHVESCNRQTRERSRNPDRETLSK